MAIVLPARTRTGLGRGTIRFAGTAQDRHRSKISDNGRVLHAKIISRGRTKKHLQASVSLFLVIKQASICGGICAHAHAQGCHSSCIYILEPGCRLECRLGVVQ